MGLFFQNATRHLTSHVLTSIKAGPSDSAHHDIKKEKER